MSFLESLLLIVSHAVFGLVLLVQAIAGSFVSHKTIVVNTPTSYPTSQKERPATTTLAQVVSATTTNTASKKIPKKVTAAASLPPSTVQTSIPRGIPTIPGNYNTQTRAALVNILCITKAGGYFRPISGSGVFISSAGVVLTNAHVGQYFLLKDYPTPDNVQCVIRTGSPATPKYTARLLFLSPEWITKNADQIVSQQAMGTGENDFVFLLITGTVDGSPPPTRFPYIPITTDEPAPGDPILLAAYPAGFLEGSTIEMSLYASSAVTNVTDVFTFNKDTVDLISVGGTVVSQAGSSGGAAVRTQDGALTGLIATASEGTTTASRDLRAITLAHINRSLKNEGQGGLLSLLTKNLSDQADYFNAKIVPGLTQKLVSYFTR